MQENCKKCSVDFEITQEDLEFYNKISPVFAGKKYEIPTPTLCPECRHIRRLSFRNEFNYYKNNCKECGINVLSVYKPGNNIKVFCQKCWWSDNWEGLNFGIEFNLKNNFFEQFDKLQKNIPVISMMNDNGINSENSEYCFNFSYGKNNYCVTTAWHSENSFYCQYGAYFKNAIDCNLIWNSKNLYECMGVGESYNCFYLNDSNNCNNCFLGIDLIGCSDCYGCIGLQNKKYYIFNKEYNKENYFKNITEINTGKYNESNSLKDEFYNFSLKYPRKATYQKNCHNCIGDRLSNCKNVEGFNIFNGEDCKYYWGGADTPKSSYDILIGGKHELGYESIVPDLTYHACFTIYCWNSSRIFYSDNCHNCSDCFGCVGLKNKSYCILNKQYTKEEYNKLVPQIIEKMKTDGEWGEFFPASLSPFGYNETVAQEYFPLKKDEIINQNFNYSDYEVPFPKVEKIIPANKLPENILEIPDDILNWAIECEISKKPFKIISQELEFYRKFNLPIPKKHPDIRHSERMKERNPRKLFDRECDKCGKNIKTTYSPDREEIVYCEDCYNKEIY